MKTRKGKNVIINTVISNTASNVHFGDNHDVQHSELIKENERLKTLLIWAKYQIKIKDTIIKKIINAKRFRIERRGK